MSLKENVEFIKKEISAEESYMENLFKFEKFYKKYKKIILITTVVAVLSTIGVSVSNYINEQNILEANIAYNTLLTNPNDKKALDILKTKNKKLYDIFIYTQNPTVQNQLEFFKQLAQYSKAIESNSIDGINSVVTDQQFLLKDFAIFNKAILQAKNKQYKDAKESLKLIDPKSDVAPVAIILEHFLITK